MRLRAGVPLSAVSRNASVWGAVARGSQPRIAASTITHGRRSPGNGVLRWLVTRYARPSTVTSAPGGDGGPSRSIIVYPVGVGAKTVWPSAAASTGGDAFSRASRSSSCSSLVTKSATTGCSRPSRFSPSSGLRADRFVSNSSGRRGCERSRRLAINSGSICALLLTSPAIRRVPFPACSRLRRHRPQRTGSGGVYALGFYAVASAADGLGAPNCR